MVLNLTLDKDRISINSSDSDHTWSKTNGEMEEKNSDKEVPYRFLMIPKD